MSATIIPDVIDAIVDLASTALYAAEITGTVISDGSVLTGDPDHLLLIGVGDPDNEQFSTAASSTTTWASADGTGREERGAITCVALAWDGAGNARNARNAATAIIDALDVAVRANYTLGLPGVFDSSIGGDFAFEQGQDADGAGCLITFQVAFAARI